MSTGTATEGCGVSTVAAGPGLHNIDFLRTCAVDCRHACFVVNFVFPFSRRAQYLRTTICRSKVYAHNQPVLGWTRPWQACEARRRTVVRAGVERDWNIARPSAKRAGHTVFPLHHLATEKR